MGTAELAVEVATQGAAIKDHERRIGGLEPEVMAHGKILSNGLTALPRMVRGMRRQLVAFALALILAILGTGFYIGERLGALDTRVEDHIEFTNHELEELRDAFPDNP